MYIVRDFVYRLNGGGLGHGEAIVGLILSIFIFEVVLNFVIFLWGGGTLINNLIFDLNQIFHPYIFFFIKITDSQSEELFIIFRIIFFLCIITFF